MRDRTHGIELAKQYPGIDGLMIGRGIFVNPFCFEPKPKEHSQKELIKLLKYHLDLFDKFSVGFSARDSEQASDSKRSEPRDIPMQSGDPVTRSAPLESCSSLDVRNSLSKNPIKFEPLKKFFKIYVNNFPGASDLRAKLMETKNTDEAREVLKLVPTAPITGGQAPEIGAGQVVASSSSRKSQSSQGVASE